MKKIMCFCLCLCSFLFACTSSHFQQADVASVDTTIPFYDEGNLLTNYDFEEGFSSAFKKGYAPMDGWLDWHAHNYEEQLWRHSYGDWDEDVSYHGKKSIFMINTAGLGWEHWDTPYFIGLEQNTQYVLKGFYKTERNTSQQVRANISARYYSSTPEAGTYTTRLPNPGGSGCRLEPSSEWKTFVNIFQYPHPRDVRYSKDTPGFDYECAVRLFGAGGPGKIWFDYLKLSKRYVFELISHKVPIMCELADVIDLQFVLLDESKWQLEERIIKTAQDWEVFADGEKLKVEQVKFDNNLWNLKVKAPDKVGLYNLKVNVKYKKSNLSLARKSFLKVAYPLKDTYAFVVMADRHAADFLPSSVEDAKDPRKIIHLCVVDLINNLRPLFVLELGDNGIWDGVFKSDTDIKYRAEAYLDFRSRIKYPVYSIAGNHDADATDKGLRCRWYYHIYCGIPYYYSFDIGSYHFIGLDSVMGVNPDFTTHGGDFQIPGMLNWFENDLKIAAQEGKKIICFFHHPVFLEFKETPARDRFLDLVCNYNVAYVFTGHHHHINLDIKKRVQSHIDENYPSDLEEVIHSHKDTPFPPHPLQLLELAKKYRNNPNYVLFETCAPMGANHHSSGPDSEQYQGIRYIWIKEGKVAWDDTLPANLKMTYVKDTPTRKVCNIKVSSKNDFNWRMRNAAGRPFTGLPLRFEMEKGNYKAYLKETAAKLPLYQIGKATITECWVQLDLKKDDSVTVVVEKIERGK